MELCPQLQQKNLASTIRARFAPLGDVELDIPPRSPMRQPPRFNWDSNKIVLDANVVSELMKSRPNTNVAGWIAGQATNSLHRIHFQ